MTPPPSIPAPTTQRPRRRLAALLALAVGGFGLYGFARLDRSVAERLGPVGEVIYDLLSPSVPVRRPDSATARRFKADVVAAHAEPRVVVLAPGTLGIFGRVEEFAVAARDRAFDDESLARLAAQHGARITDLVLENTAITDAGLRHLRRFPSLRYLRVRGRVTTGTGVTDAGMIHLRGLGSLESLNLGGLPITDRGLAALGDLPRLIDLNLSGTRVQGRGWARLRCLPQLITLNLADTEAVGEGFQALQGAQRLVYLSLDRVPLDGTAIPALRAIPSLNQLDMVNCGLPAAEIAAFRQARPGLRVTLE